MKAGKEKLLNWILFIALCIIWGSSFILMKEGMKALTAWQVAAIRILSAALVLLPIGIQRFKLIPKEKLGYVILSGLLGSFFPAFLFCLAETRIDSSLAGFLNALTPIVTLTIGILFFNAYFRTKRLIGVLIGFVGMLVLFLSGQINFQYISYSSLVILATICYGSNVNMVTKHLKEIGSVNIAAVSFTFLCIPSFLILFFTGYFFKPIFSTTVSLASLASVVLGVLGTAFASIIFYALLKRAGVLFSSMVTYGIPFVALTWGLIAGESITMMQILGLGIILSGVFLANRQG